MTDIIYDPSKDPSDGTQPLEMVKITPESTIVEFEIVKRELSIYGVGNVLQARFLVAVANLIWCADFTWLDVGIAGKTTRTRVFVCIDLATYQVVTWCVGQSLTASDVVGALQPKLTALFCSAMSPPYLVLHTDNGPEFTSNTFTNLEVVFSKLILSRSRTYTATDNSVCERAIRTLFNQPATAIAAGYPNGIPTQVGDISEAKAIVDAFINAHNSRARSERSLGLTPDQAACSFIIANNKGLMPPDIWLAAAANIPAFAKLNGKADIEAYRSQVAEIGHKTFTDIPKTPEELNAQQRDRFLAAQALYQMEANAVTQSQLAAISSQLTALSSAAPPAASKKPKNAKKIANARLLRTPSEPRFVEAYTQYASEQQKLVIARDAVGFAVLLAIGSRPGEIRLLTDQDVDCLAAGNPLPVNLIKTRAKNKAFTNTYVASLVKKAWEVYKELLALSGYSLSPTARVFANLNDPNNMDRANALSEDAFLESMTETCDKFNAWYKEKFGEEVNLKPGSGRIGYITELRAQGFPSETIMQLTGHKSAASIRFYDRYQLSDKEKQDIVNTMYRRKGTQ